MGIKCFITGTDTSVGKSYISIGILKAFNRLAYSTLGMKVIASGCDWRNGQWVNEDALLLQQTSTIKLSYQHINPFAFEPAIAPHLAAHLQKRELNLQQLINQTHIGLHYPADMTLIEGVGGWNVPLNHEETMAELVKHYDLPVILVIGIRLGCLNHAILTYRAMLQDRVKIVGWIANCIDPNMTYRDENIAALKTWLSIPHLGTVGYQSSPEDFINVKNIATITKLISQQKYF